MSSDPTRTISKPQTPLFSLNRCNPPSRHRAFMPTSYDGPVPGDSPNRLAISPHPLSFEPGEPSDLVEPVGFTGCRSLDQGPITWPRATRAEPDVHGTSRRSPITLQPVLPPVWPTDVALMGTFVEHSRRSEFADALEELEPSGAPVWAVEFLESYFSHDRVKFSEKIRSLATIPGDRRSFDTLRKNVKDMTRWYDAISRLYIPTRAELCASGINPYWGMRHVRHEVGSPRWLYALRQMVFNTVEPGFSGQMEWNKVHVHLANLLRLPKAWGGRHSVLSLMRVGDDRVLTPPSWCTTVP
ncbi:hypothetical protein BS47DRAFT_1402628 [Hydnum rufescens UP504]|uniref:Uncharacterized protein n=1 Tax=Hydnum rufescens UP504 TaxID=1448309 RepID=A0A9P6ACR1_9AGAM|nr:hypothetical protein BS47DRAFT_1402628 [Hydnum rufescens UP504]